MGTDLKYLRSCMVAIGWPEYSAPLKHKDKLIRGLSSMRQELFLPFRPEKKGGGAYDCHENDPMFRIQLKNTSYVSMLGHGGGPRGQYPHGSPTSQYKEKDITLKIALETGRLLGQMGYEVFLYPCSR